MIRVGVPGFLNTRVITYPLERGLVERGVVDLVMDVPSNLNRALHEGGIDLGLVSSAALHEGDLVVPGISISAFGRVDSVLLLSSVEAEALDGRTVRLSRDSCTGNLLTKILCRERFGVSPRFIIGGEGDVDAEVSIGDPALVSARSGRWRCVYDLALEWVGWTSLPMVFAVLAAREDSEQVKRAAGTIIAARDAGIAHVGDIVRSSHPEFLSEEETRQYITNIDYTLSEAHLRSLEIFHRMLREGSLAEPPSRTRTLW